MSGLDTDQKPATHKRRRLIMYIWWAHHYSGENWSEEERWLRKTVYLVGAVTFSFIFLPLGYGLTWFGLDEHWSAAISFVAAYLVGLPVSRWLCGLLWLERVHKAEQNAGRRYGDRPVRW